MKSKRKHFFACVGFSFYFGSGATAFASLRSGVGRKYYDLHCPHFSPEVMVKLKRTLRGHFMTFIEVGMHLIGCNPGQLPREEVSSAAASHFLADSNEKFPLVSYWAHHLAP